MISSSPQLTAGSVVRATRRLVDEVLFEDVNAIFAEPGEIGALLYAEGDQLTVAWEQAPHAMTCFLGEDCEVFMQLLPGGIA